MGSHTSKPASLPVPHPLTPHFQRKRQPQVTLASCEHPLTPHFRSRQLQLQEPPTPPPYSHSSITNNLFTTSSSLSHSSTTSPTPQITASTTPQWTWTHTQTTTWLISILITTMGLPSKKAEKIVRRNFKGCGRTLWQTTRREWIGWLGEGRGRAMFSIMEEWYGERVVCEIPGGICVGHFKGVGGEWGRERGRRFC